MATLTISGVDPDLKHEATEILKEHGMTIKSAMSAFLRTIVTEHKEGRCFCHDLEVNEETRRVFEETDRGENIHSFSSPTEMFKHLKAQ
jgi:antitoxin component of RelBE/YafQ-DinJ toxin-antitoxin module